MIRPSDFDELKPLAVSSLALLVTRVLADNHDAAVATDHLALVADRLDAWLDLHVRSSLRGTAGLGEPGVSPRYYLYR